MQSTDTASFFEACRRNDVAAVQAFCEADPGLLSVQDAKGYTPVLIAVYNNAPDVAQLLLSKGAPANVPDAAGNTALMGAAFKGYHNMVKALIEVGVDVNQRNESGATALTFAATFGQMEIAEDLLENGALLDLVDSRGKSPIDHAVIQENEPMVRLLEKYERMRMNGQSMLGDN
jgi:ankyrin repeat protein